MSTKKNSRSKNAEINLVCGFPEGPTPVAFSLIRLDLLKLSWFKIGLHPILHRGSKKKALSSSLISLFFCSLSFLAIAHPSNLLASPQSLCEESTRPFSLEIPLPSQKAPIDGPPPFDSLFGTSAGHGASWGPSLPPSIDDTTFHHPPSQPFANPFPWLLTCLGFPVPVRFFQ